MQKSRFFSYKKMIFVVLFFALSVMGSCINSYAESEYEKKDEITYTITSLPIRVTLWSKNGEDTISRLNIFVPNENAYENINNVQVRGFRLKNNQDEQEIKEIYVNNENGKISGFTADVFDVFPNVEKINITTSRDFTLPESNGKISMLINENSSHKFNNLSSFSVTVKNDAKPTYVSYNGALYKRNGTNSNLVFCPAQKQGIIDIAGSCNVINQGVFDGCNKVNGISFVYNVTNPKSVTLNSLPDNIKTVYVNGNKINIINSTGKYEVIHKVDINNNLLGITTKDNVMTVRVMKKEESTSTGIIPSEFLGNNTVKSFMTGVDTIKILKDEIENIEFEKEAFKAENITSIIIDDNINPTFSKDENGKVNVFDDCTSLQNITYKKVKKETDESDNGYYTYNGLLYNGNELVFCPPIISGQSLKIHKKCNIIVKDVLKNVKKSISTLNFFNENGSIKLENSGEFNNWDNLKIYMYRGTYFSGTDANLSNLITYKYKIKFHYKTDLNNASEEEEQTFNNTGNSSIKIITNPIWCGDGFNTTHNLWIIDSQKDLKNNLNFDEIIKSNNTIDFDKIGKESGIFATGNSFTIDIEKFKNTVIDLYPLGEKNVTLHIANKLDSTTQYCSVYGNNNSGSYYLKLPEQDSFRESWEHIGWRLDNEPKIDDYINKNDIIKDPISECWALYKANATIYNGSSSNKTVDSLFNPGTGYNVKLPNFQEIKNWTFDGWSINPNNAYEKEDYLKLSDDGIYAGDALKFYAVYSREKNISYYLDKSENEPSYTTKITEKYKFGTDPSFTTIKIQYPQTISKKGYTFKNWTVSEDSQNNYKSGDNYTLTTKNTNSSDTLKIYANWEPNVYEITLQENNQQKIYLKYGDGVYSDEKCTQKKSSVECPKQDGKTFLGYSDNEHSTNIYINKNGRIDTNLIETSLIKTSTPKSVVLKPRWEKNALHIYYHPNNGQAKKDSDVINEGEHAGTIEGGIYYSDDDLKLPTEDLFRREGYSLGKEWLTDSYGSETFDTNNWKNQIKDGSKTIILYAKWIPNVYKITLKNDNNTTYIYEKYDSGYYKDEDCTQNIYYLDKPSKDGYKFMGYFYNEKQIISEYGQINASNKSFSSNTELTPKWEANKLTITYDKNGGTQNEDVETQQKIEYDDKDIELKKVSDLFKYSGYYIDTKEEWKYSGTDWTEKTVGEDSKEELRKLIKSNDASVKLSANWKPNSFTIVYHSNYDNDTITEKTYTYSSYGITLNSPNSRSGYDFVSWNTKSDGTGDDYSSLYGAKISCDNNEKINLYAQWKPKNGIKYTIYYKRPKLNSENEYDTETLVKYGTVGENVEAPIKTYEGFEVTNKQQNLTIKGDGSSSVTYTYKRKSYKFTLNNPQNSHVSLTTNSTQSSTNMQYGKEIILKAEAETGYKFENWTYKYYGTEDTNDVLKGKNLKNVEIRFTMPAGDIEITPVSTPISNTKYTVKHWLQNIDGDVNLKNDTNYTLKESHEYTGTTDTTITPIVNNYLGFIQPETKTSKIKGDGTTVINYYYARNSYNFTLGQANGVDTTGSSNTQKYLYGEKISLNALPTSGYEFQYWESSNSDLISDKKVTTTTFAMPAGDITMTPITTVRTDTKYTVRHWQQNIDAESDEENEDNYSIVTKDTIVARGTTGSTITPIVNSYNGFKTPNAKTVTIKGDGTTVINYYYTRNKYNFTLEKSEGINTTGSVKTGKYYYGQKIDLIAIAENGYKFVKWDSNNAQLTGKTGNQYSFFMPAENITMKPIAQKIEIDNPGEDNPGEDNPGEDNPGEDNPGEDNKDEKIELKESAKSNVKSFKTNGDETTYYIVEKSSKVSDVLEYFENSEKLSVKDLKNTDNVKTGSEIKIKGKEDKDTKVKIIMKGDLNSDGQVTFDDVMILNSYRLRSQNEADLFSVEQKLAYKSIKNGEIEIDNRSVNFKDDVLILNTYRLQK